MPCTMRAVSSACFDPVTPGLASASPAAWRESSYISRAQRLALPGSRKKPSSPAFSSWADRPPAYSVANAVQVASAEARLPLVTVLRATISLVMACARSGAPLPPAMAAVSSSCARRATRLFRFSTRLRRSMAAAWRSASDSSAAACCTASCGLLPNSFWMRSARASTWSRMSRASSRLAAPAATTSFSQRPLTAAAPRR